MTLSAIIAALKALPELVKLLKEIGRAYEKMDFEKDLREIQDAHDQWDKANSFEERMAAARRIAKLGKRL